MHTLSTPFVWRRGLSDLWLCLLHGSWPSSSGVATYRRPACGAWGPFRCRRPCIWISCGGRVPPRATHRRRGILSSPPRPPCRSLRSGSGRRNVLCRGRCVPHSRRDSSPAAPTPTAPRPWAARALDGNGGYARISDGRCRRITCCRGRRNRPATLYPRCRKAPSYRLLMP